MAFYSEELIEEVRSRNDIVDVISGYVRLQKKGSRYFGLCPFHNEKTPSFSVSPGNQLYYCFGCGAGGTVLTFVMKYENVTFTEAMQRLAGRAGVALPEREMSKEQRERADRRAKLLEINREAAKYFYTLLRDPRGKHALEYFQKRELTAQTMQHFGLGYSAKYGNNLYQYLKKLGYADDLLKDSGLVTIDEVRGGYDKFWNRAMFPIMDVNHRVIGFGGRVMGDGEPKYLNSPETMIFDKSRNLYGLNFARSSRRPGILLCEGYMDVIALHQAGFDNAVASLGTSFTSGHASLLKRYTKEVYLTFDSDGAGVRAALRAIPILKEAGLVAKVIDMQPHKDPDEFIRALGAQEYQKRIDAAENSFLFEIRMLEREYDLSDPEGKTAFFRKVSARLLEFREPLERENYIEAITRHYQIGFEQLRSMVNRAGAREGIAAEDRPQPVSGRRHRKKDDGMKQSQRLLLRWLVEEPSLFDVVGAYITPEDFTVELYRQAAQALYEQHSRGELNPARIVSLFPGEEQQREVAGLFQAGIQLPEDARDRQKALTETVRRVKQNSMEVRSKQLDPTDIAGLQRLIEERKSLAKLHIYID
ncbi:MAG: DNA primase [Clostridiales bacterium]|nr:DNA primase [Clostridiales bacterium]MCD8132870.1 DNA primase [Clostridiales bacterium]